MCCRLTFKDVAGACGEAVVSSGKLPVLTNAASGTFQLFVCVEMKINRKRKGFKKAVKVEFKKR